MAKKQTVLGAVGAVGGLVGGASVGGMGLAVGGTAIGIPALVPTLLFAAAGWYICRKVGKHLDKKAEMKGE